MGKLYNTLVRELYCLLVDVDINENEWEFIVQSAQPLSEPYVDGCVHYVLVNVPLYMFWEI